MYANRTYVYLKFSNYYYNDKLNKLVMKMLFASIPYKYLKQNFKLGNVKVQNVDILEYRTRVYT